MTVGERIKNKRIEMGYTQLELAKKMGYSTKSAICNVEKNGDNITTDRVLAFAKALNTTPSFLMGWEEVYEEAIPNSYKEEVPEYDASIQEVIALYSKLTQEQKATVLAMLRSFIM